MEIAYGRFAKEDGMVVDIRKYKDSQNVVFNCRFWSDFTEENERLYIACTGVFFIKSIHNVSTTEDYEPFIQSISIFQEMIDGYAYTFGAMTSRDVVCLSELLHDNQENEMNVPDYIRQFFNNFCNQIKVININMEWINEHDESSKFGNYGFVRLKELFWKNESIELIKFAKLFRNTISKITIYNAEARDYVTSIELDSGFETELVKFMIFINSSAPIKNRFKSLIIVNPKIDDIDTFIDEKKDYYITKYGWMVEKGPYHDIKRNAKCHDTIYFFPIV